jgi:uncharacterized OsmC-like protein
MADNTVVVGTTRTQGRFLAEARERLLVVDSTDGRGGRGQAWLAGELLLAALGACATSSVTHFAREEGIALDDVEATASYTRHPTDPTAYEEVLLEVTTWDVTQEQAELLVRLYTENCPVYGTTSRGGKVRLVVRAQAGRRTGDR